MVVPLNYQYQISLKAAPPLWRTYIERMLWIQPLACIRRLTMHNIFYIMHPTSEGVLYKIIVLVSLIIFANGLSANARSKFNGRQVNWNRFPFLQKLKNLKFKWIGKGSKHPLRFTFDRPVSLTKPWVLRRCNLSVVNLQCSDFNNWLRAFRVITCS